MISYEEYLTIGENYNLIPVYEEIITDTETPVTLYRKLTRANDYSFLLESHSRNGQFSGRGRYSFIGLTPEMVVKNTGAKVTVNIKKRGQNNLSNRTDNLIDFIDSYRDQFSVYKPEGLPPFSGGFVGYFGYEIIEEWEDLYHNKPHKSLQTGQLPSAILVLAKLIVAYDHLNNTVKIIYNIKIDDDLTRQGKLKLYRQARRKIHNLIELIRKKKQGFSGPDGPDRGKIKTGKFTGNTSRDKFIQMVTEGKEYIRRGEIFQLVLSQKFSLQTELSPFQIYRALRVSNPSPYMFYLNFPEVKLIGSSPEILVQVKDDRVITRPLAGTRPRGETGGEDNKLAKNLLEDEKERAEHIMLVDLGRNDLGRVCRFNSIEVIELMGIEYFSRVMHLVSQVEGEKKEHLSSLDVLKSVFPAGTVTGAPKIRAVELINELEKEPRGTYAGAVGYLDFSGNLDTCITIRTFSYRNKLLTVQAGAGIVADSRPAAEYRETINKARALFKALEITEKEEPYGLGH